jgi:predicted nucleic acid-binding protein
MQGKGAFFDTSALVPLCVTEAASESARQSYRRFTSHIVAWTALIEATSALQRARRLGGLNDLSTRRGLDRLVQIERRWMEILPTDRVRSIALDVLRAYDLRAADAIQLASALVWCKEKPRHRPLVCFDQRLAASASTAGFDVIGI